MDYILSDIARIISAKNQVDSNQVISQLLTDSRKIYFPSASLFFALQGTHTDGHDYIGKLYEAQVMYFVVTKVPIDHNFPGAIFLEVEDTQVALQSLASYHRHRFTYPVIGITGSNGKTIVKELLYQLLHNDYSIVRSPKSYNSQIGVPLSVWQMSDGNDLAIFEAGISEPGEMDRLQPIIDPDIGVFNYIGDAHSEGFKSMADKIQEKLKLFRNAKVLIYSRNDLLIHDALSALEKPGSTKLFSWGLDASADLHVIKISKSIEETQIECAFETSGFQFIIPFTDDASIHNALNACCVLLYMKIPFFMIAQRMKMLVQVEMRMELKQGLFNCSIINDSYSSDINSLSIALDFLQQQQQHTKRSLVLSDVLQSGLKEERLYKLIADVVAEKNLFRFIGVGDQMKKYAGFFVHENTQFFSTTEELLDAVPAMNFRDETILLKGARIFEFERISQALEQKTHQTVLEIDLGAVRHNLAVYREQLNPGVKLMAMVKAFSYGSGSFEIANILQFAEVDYLAVAYADEGVELRKSGIKLPVMVMNADESAFDSLVKYDLEPELYSFHILDLFKQYLEQRKISNYPVHLKFDTGMHRLGFEDKDLEDLTARLKGNLSFDIKTVFSHLVASDEAIHDSFTGMQQQLFLSMANRVESVAGKKIIRHLANTSAISRLPVLQLDMVRLGIGLYGVDSNPEVQKKLKPVATLKSTVAQLKFVKQGESVGYSRKGILEKDSLIATVRVGYADGYQRNLGNGNGWMLVNGRAARIVGNVCMDMTMIDVTGFEVSEDDEVIVFGEGLPVYKLAEWGGTISYEILTGISQRVKRVYFET